MQLNSNSTQYKHAINTSQTWNIHKHIKRVWNIIQNFFLQKLLTRQSWSQQLCSHTYWYCVFLLDEYALNIVCMLLSTVYTAVIPNLFINADPYNIV